MMNEPMEPINIYNNLKNWDYDISGYPMTKTEAEVVIVLLEKEMNKNASEKG